MKRSVLIIAAIAILLMLAAVFVIGILPGDKWQAYPGPIIVDTPEEFQRKNTP